MMTTHPLEDREDPFIEDTAGTSRRSSRISAWLDERVSVQIRKRLAVWGRGLLLAGVFFLLIYKLSGIGWANILRDIPGQPLFYLIFAAMYIGLPIAETFIYWLIWELPLRQIFPEMIKKRVFNKDVFNYSGEANLFVWARGKLDRSSRLILRDIKDNTVISSLTSMFIALVLLTAFVLSGVLPFEALAGELDSRWVVGGGICVALLIALAVRFRKSVVALHGSLTMKLFGIHAGRLIFVQALQILQWMVVMPEVPIVAWFTLLAAQIIANQIPLIPAKDLLVVAASVEIAGWLELSASAVTGMLLVSAVLDKVVNLILFSYLSIRSRSDV